MPNPTIEEINSFTNRWYETLHNYNRIIEEAVNNDARLQEIIDDSQRISDSFITLNNDTGHFEYHPSDETPKFPYQPLEQELEDYDFYLRRRNPSCRNDFPIAIGKLAERFLNIINTNLAEIGIQ